MPVFPAARYINVRALRSKYDDFCVTLPGSFTLNIGLRPVVERWLFWNRWVDVGDRLPRSAFASPSSNLCTGDSDGATGSSLAAISAGAASIDFGRLC